MFKVIKKDKKTKARVGKLKTAHGVIETPAFMPVGTQASVKGLTPEEVKGCGAQIILSNAYHLYLRPGLDVIKRAGGLHKFMGWDGPILTDSGGFQLFSLSVLVKLTDKGAHFKSHIDGSAHFFTPEDVMRLQKGLASDIIMILDECPAYPCKRKDAEIAVSRTLDWARRSKKEFSKGFTLHASRFTAKKQQLFGIVQGSSYLDLRQRCAEELIDLDFDGYAIGGVSVGEPTRQIRKVVAHTTPLLPENKPRYLMGMGEPEDILAAVAEGVDMFDCVVPTRAGRNATAFTRKGKIHIRNAKYKYDKKPIEAGCGCYACRNFTRSYIRHLFNTREMLGPILLTRHNIWFYTNMMREIRDAIKGGRNA